MSRRPIHIPPLTPEQRVRGLLACGLWSPWIREATIAGLLADPETAPFVPLTAQREAAKQMAITPNARRNE